MIRGIGITEWEAPFRDERLCPWAAGLGMDTVSMEFDAAKCRDEADTRKWALSWKQALEDSGLAPSVLGVNILCDTGMILPENEDACRRYIDLAMYAACVMNVPAVHIPSFFDSWIADEAQLRQTVRVLRAACELGERYGIETGHEAVLRPEWCETVIEETASPSFFMLYDNENHAQRGIDPLRVFLRFPDLYRHAHFKHSDADGRPLPLGEDTRFGGPAPVMEAMRRHGFDGWVLLESPYKRAGSLQEAEETIRRDLDLIRAMFPDGKGETEE